MEKEMFYDSERVIRKNEKYEKSKAYEAIQKLEHKGLSVIEMINALDILLDDDNTEFHQDVLGRAKSILEARKEASNEEISNNITTDSSKFNGSTRNSRFTIS